MNWNAKNTADLVRMALTEMQYDTAVAATLETTKEECARRLLELTSMDDATLRAILPPDCRAAVEKWRTSEHRQMLQAELKTIDGKIEGEEQELDGETKAVAIAAAVAVEEDAIEEEVSDEEIKAIIEKTGRACIASIAGCASSFEDSFCPACLTTDRDHNELDNIAVRAKCESMLWLFENYVPKKDAMDEETDESMRAACDEVCPDDDPELDAIAAGISEADAVADELVRESMHSVLLEAVPGVDSDVVDAVLAYIDEQHAAARKLVQALLKSRTVAAKSA